MHRKQIRKDSNYSSCNLDFREAPNIPESKIATNVNKLFSVSIYRIYAQKSK